MRYHLYEFRATTKQLKCQCGWEKKLRSSSVEQAYKEFKAHRTKASLAPAL